MPLVELERWLQARVDRHPVATSLPMLDGYVAAIVAGPVSISPLDWICPLLAIDADAFNHGGTPEFAAISAVAQHHNAISKTLSTNAGSVRADAPAQAEWRRRCASLVSGILRRHAAQDIGLGAVCWTPATSITACSCPSCCTVATIRAVRCSDRQTRPARPSIPAQRPRRYPSGRRGHAPILDADPLRPRWLITAYVGAHAGYG